MRGSVEKRGKGYSIRLDLGKDPKTGRRRQKRISGFKTKKDAEAELAKLIADHERGALVLPSKVTVAEFMRYWLDTHKENLAFTTERQYRTIIEQHIIPCIGEMPLGKLTPLCLQDFLRKLRQHGRKDNKKSRGKELSPSSVNYVYRLLRCALNAAVKWKLIPENPALFVDPPAAEAAPPTILTPAEVRKLLDGLKGTYLYLPVYLAVRTGMRLGEILALTWDDVDTERCLITVRRTLPQQRKTDNYQFKAPKTKSSSRTFPISPAVAEKLKQVKKEQDAHRKAVEEVWHDYNLVCCRGDGTPLHPPTISSRFPKEAKKLGFDLTFHSLRDVSAGLMLLSGAPLKAISIMLGHGSGAVTMDKYLGMAPQVLQTLVTNVDALLEEGDDNGVRDRN